MFPSVGVATELPEDLFFFLGCECLFDRLVCSSRRRHEEESCHPESSDSCTGLHAECLWVGKEGGMQVEMKSSFSPSFS